MPKHKYQRVGIFVDIQNMYYSAKQMYSSKVNFAHILKRGVAGRSLIRAIAYVIKADIKEESNFFDALEKIGYDVRAKDLQTFYGGAKKGDWDVGIAMDIMRMASKLDVVVLGSGDGDFKDLLEHVKALGCRAEVIAFGKTCSSRLQNETDDFIDLDKELEATLINYKNRSHSSNRKDSSSSSNRSSNSSNNSSSSSNRSSNSSNSSSSSSNRSSSSSNRSSGSSKSRSSSSRNRSSSRRSSGSRHRGNRDFQRNDNASLIQKINMDQPDLSKVSEEDSKSSSKKPTKSTKTKTAKKSTKSASAKKSTTKKSTAKKSTSAKKSTAKKSTTKKSTAKKSTSAKSKSGTEEKKSTETSKKAREKKKSMLKKVFGRGE